MPKNVYEKAGKEINDLVQTVLERHHPELAGLEPKIAVLVVHKFDEDDQPLHALKHHGALAAATIKRISTRRRPLVDHDFEIDLDGMTWNTSTEAEQVALIDHELEHIVVCRDEGGAPKHDDLGHVKYKLRPDEFTITGFFSVVERHGLHAGEAKSVSRLHERLVIALDTNSKKVTQLVAA